MTSLVWEPTVRRRSWADHMAGLCGSMEQSLPVLVHMCTHVCVFMCVCVCARARAHVHVHVCVCACVRVCMCAHGCMCMCERVQTCAHVLSS